MQDLADFHSPVSELFQQPKTKADWEQYRLSQEQIDFFHENGYLADVKLLNERQVEALKSALDEVMDPAHPLHHLFHEFHSNESGDPNKVLFHSLGSLEISSCIS